MHADISGIKAGKTVVSIEVKKDPEGVVVASTSFPVLVKEIDKFQPCLGLGEVVKKAGFQGACCKGLVLTPSFGDRSDVYGICLKSCRKDGDCYNNEACQLIDNRSVCIPKTKIRVGNETEIKKLKEGFKQITKDLEEQKAEQGRIKKILVVIQNFLNKLKKVFPIF